MNLPKLKNSEALVACLFIIHLSISTGHPVHSSPVDGRTAITIAETIFNFENVTHNDPITRQVYQLSEVGGIKEPVASTTETFHIIVNQSGFNITGSSINLYRSDPFVESASDQTEGPLTTDIPDWVEIITPFPVNEVSKTIPVESHEINGLGSLSYDLSTTMVPSPTDTPVDLSSFVRTVEPELQWSSVTPSVPQDLFYLQMSVTTSPSVLSFTNDTGSVGESRDLSDNLKMLQEKETVSNVLGDYLLPPVEVSEFQSTSIASSDPAGHISMTSTASPVASAYVSNLVKEEDSKQPYLSPDISTLPIFNPSENSASKPLPIDTVASQKTSVETVHSFHAPISMLMPSRKLVDIINPFPLNPAWPAKMGFHSYSALEEPMTQFFNNKRFTIHAKEKLNRRIMPGFQLDPTSHSGMHSLNPQVGPGQFKYRQPYSHGYPRSPYPHAHDDNYSIHRSFESLAPRKSGMFAFPGISSTRENFRFRVDWVDEI